MREATREISKEVYERAKANNGYLTKEDEIELFDPAILYGYGLYGTHAYEKDGKYWLDYSVGSSCD